MKISIAGTMMTIKKITFLIIIIRMSRIGAYALHNVDSLHVTFGIYINFKFGTLK